MTTKLNIKDILKDNILNLMNEFIKEMKKNIYSNELYNDDGEYNFIKWLKYQKNIIIDIDNYILDLNKIIYELSFKNKYGRKWEK